ncbi:MAG: PQQ-binding-like beta-propeller repeat protein [Phycisphaerales bacterium]|nr:PQQ-binding-like beta-propeller repeat protein [Phycisphaerales bacterium]
MRAVPRTRRVAAGVVLALACLLAPGARAQDNPVFVDDSTLAADVLSGLPGLLASDNTGEAVRLLQRLLEEEGGRLVATPDNPDLLEPVRARVHRVLLADARLLERYRTVEAEAGARLLAEGRADAVERSRLLTPPGFDAAVRVAAAHLAGARFESARITLEQLEDHPDRDDPARAGAAAAVWAQLAGYLAREPVVGAARRWADRAGSGVGPVGAVEWPASLRTPVYSPLAGSPGFALGELLDTPLCSAELRAGQVMIEEAEPVTRRSRSSEEFPFLFPLVSGDTVYATDGLWIGAWDRFTLTPRWRTKPRGADNEREQLEEMYAANAYRRNRSRDVEEPTAVALHGRLLVAATGVVADGARQGDPRLHALDAQTGRVLWSSYIDELDPRLDESSSRGPAVFEGDTAVVAVRKISQSRRFASAFLVGIDLADGSAKWVSLSGSAGWLAYGGRGQWSDWPTLHEGIVYRVDELGVICAVEAGTGRFRWVLRLPGVESRTASPRVPWGASQVIVDGDTLLALAPDRGELLRLDRHSGRILARRDTQPLGLPGYIFEHDGLLVAVAPARTSAPARVATLPLALAESAPARISDPIAEPGILGRVVASADALLVPLSGGMGVLDLATLEPRGGVALRAPGNLIPVGKQLLTADNESLHSYLVWADAAAVLQARLDADPADLAAALSFAELAHRANHPEAMLAPIDAAMTAMAADPLGDQVAPAQARLFGLLLTALRAALDGAEQQGGGLSSQPQGGGLSSQPEGGGLSSQPEGGGLSSPRADDPTAISPATLDGLTERMAMVALTPDQRATHLLMRSRVHEHLGRVAEAVADCQGVLADPSLAGAVWARGPSSVRAEIDALARLDRLLTEHGRGAYAPFEREADATLGAMADADAGALEAFARAYPRAPAALRAWLAGAEGRAEAAESLALDRALDRGLHAAAAMRAVGISPDPVAVGELLGRRLTALLGANRLDTAAELLLRSAADWPGVTITSAGVALDRGAMADTLRARAEARSRRPEIGDAPVGTPALLDGWVLMRALDRRDAFAARPGVMMLGPGVVGLWSLDAGRPVAEWTAPTGVKPVLLRFDPDRVLLLEPDDRGGTLRALSPADGRELWSIERLGEVLALARGPAAVAGQERFETPLDGEVSATDMLLALDEATLAVVSRAGRVAGIDLATGRVGWTVRTDCQQVSDASAGEGVVAIGGVGAPRTGDAAGEPVVVLLDLATGEEISRYAPGSGGASGRVRWVHVALGSSRVVVGLSRGLVSLSLPDAQAEWALADMAVEQTDAAWPAGARLFVQSSLRELALVDGATGELLAPRLDTADCLEAGEPTDAVADPGAERLTVLSPAGYCQLDASTGALLAADAIGRLAGDMVQPATGAGRVVLVEREPVAGAPGFYRLHILETETGRAISTSVLALSDRPRRVGLLDGAVWVTAGDSTVVVPMR